MYNEVIYLLQRNLQTTNKYGDNQVGLVERQVFAEVKSIGQKEFYEAQTLGLKPEIKFVIPDFYDYQGEEKLKYTPFQANATAQYYDIIRTYRAGNTLEIICTRSIEK